jgi:hypothetical protein
MRSVVLRHSVTLVGACLYANSAFNTTRFDDSADIISYQTGVGVQRCIIAGLAVDGRIPFHGSVTAASRVCASHFHKPAAAQGGARKSGQVGLAARKGGAETADDR